MAFQKNFVKRLLVFIQNYLFPQSAGGGQVSALAL
jgi:hypothetical protein